MRSIAVLFVAVLTVSPAASCTAPHSMDAGITDWWANRLAGLAGNRPPKPYGLALSAWSTSDFTIMWRRGPAFLSTPRADRWEVRIARGDWTAARATDVPGGILSTGLDRPPRHNLEDSRPSRPSRPRRPCSSTRSSWGSTRSSGAGSPGPARLSSRHPDRTDDPRLHGEPDRGAGLHADGGNQGANADDTAASAAGRNETRRARPR